MTLTHQNMLDEDTQLLEQLKAKWQPGTGAAPPATDADVNQDNNNSPSSLDKIRICMECQGSGMKTEVYEYRRMESTCPRCKGEGMLNLGGPPTKPKQQSGTNHSSASGPAGQQQQDCASSKRVSEKQHSSKSTHRPSFKTAKALQHKIDQLAKEAADLQAALDTAAGSEEERELQRALVSQLRCHLQRLTEQQQLSQQRGVVQLGSVS